MLEQEHGYKLKGTGKISYHLGYDCFRDKDNNLCYAPRKYIEKMLEVFLRLFGFWRLLGARRGPKGGGAACARAHARARSGSECFPLGLRGPPKPSFKTVAISM